MSIIAGDGPWHRRASGGEHPINVVVRRTGLSQHVIRQWEHRYGVVTPMRSAGNRRLYTDAHVDRLRLLARAVQTGHPIGQIAHLPDETLLSYIAEDDAVRQPPLPAMVVDPMGSAADAQEACLHAIAQLDPRDLTGRVARAHQQFGHVELLDAVVAPLMGEVGARFAAGTLRIAHEHMASAVVRTYLGGVFERTVPERQAPAAVAATLSGELHELGALGAAMAAAAEGWRVTYLGPDVPPDEVAHAVQAQAARVLMLSIVSSPEPAASALQLQEVADRCGRALRIICGGGSTQQVVARLPAPLVVTARDARGLRHLLRQRSGAGASSR